MKRLLWQVRDIHKRKDGQFEHVAVKTIKRRKSSTRTTGT